MLSYVVLSLSTMGTALEEGPERSKSQSPGGEERAVACEGSWSCQPAGSVVSGLSQQEQQQLRHWLCNPEPQAPPQPT